MSLGMQEILPDGGLASFQYEVSRLADLGRYEDAYIVHAAEGETVVPMAVFDENPGLKAMLFAQMRGMGIDPERYIVGNELNSINPVTGQPEFFLKKIFKGAKKALKAVAPYAGLIAGAMGAGPWYSALAGGIGGLYGSEGDLGAGAMGALGGYGAGTAFGTRGENYIFGEGAKGGGWDQLKSNIGFGGSTTAGGDQIALTARQAEIKGVPVGTTWDDLYKLGMIDNPAASKMTGWEKAILFGGPLMGVAGEYFSGDDDDSEVDWGPSYMPWGGNFAAPGVSYSANGGIINAYDNGGPVDRHPGTSPKEKYGAGWSELSDKYNEMIQLGSLKGISPGIAGKITEMIQRGVLPGIKGTDDALPALLSDRLQEEQTTRMKPFADFLGKQKRTPQIAYDEEGNVKSIQLGEDVEMTAENLIPPDNQRMMMEELLATNKTIRKIDKVLDALTDDQSRAGLTGQVNEMIQMGSGSIAELMGMDPNELAYMIARARKSSGQINEDDIRHVRESLSMTGFRDARSALVQLYTIQDELKDSHADKMLMFEFEGGELPEGYAGFKPYQGELEYTEDKYADGGIAHLAGGSFPRMSGAIAGPGGPKDDMVPAMLSDGEFVMTADAVRNAGGGDRREGARRMYQLMNQLQGAA